MKQKTWEFLSENYVFKLFTALLFVFSVTAEVKAIDTNAVKVRTISPNTYFVGFGPQAHDSNASLLGLYPGETEDLSPTPIAFGDDDINDSLEITVKALKNINGNVRVVLISDATNTVLSSISYRATFNPGEYEMDWQDTVNGKINPADSVEMESLKWLSIGTYMTVIQKVSVSDQILSATANCDTCIPHDMRCTGIGPLNINRIRVYAPCYGTTWVDLKKCCRGHDIDLWCAANYLDILKADLSLSSCVFSTVAGHVANKVPWYCGGIFVGSIAGLIQGTIVSSMVYAAVTVISHGLITDDLFGEPNKFIYKGRELNSCLCGGEVKTRRCRTGEILCEGITFEPELEVTGGGDLCACTSANFNFQVNPHVPGHTYTWSATSGISVNSTGNGSTATVTATQRGTVTVTIHNTPCGDVVLSRFITIGVPKPPKMKNRQPTVACYDHNVNVGGWVNKEGSCATSWSWRDFDGNEFTEPTGYITFPLQREIKKDVWVKCFAVRANNACGSSEWTEYCITIFDCCPGCKRSLLDENDDSKKTLQTLEVFPNPAKNEVTVNVPELWGVSKLRITDITGRVIKHVNFSSTGLNVINIESLDAGNYIFNLESSEGEFKYSKITIE